ncbi:hypothetical protein ONS95_007461 [Cadophora gregata]|uniref:uncharacterized protein n=1 Tax=Cadophora gregata TaxID=51156 RepID=UPI0026DAAA56|nr:uncharacterized protein ONS95_007461 [Cadophora gregata]KAK0118575.1 hypothetical protein ONS96_011667 [Cadophora gregata f. sp. sojae]KAK0125830.1 hypothetical protein ONS95_007461 [Cadophora gregata]
MSESQDQQQHGPPYIPKKNALIGGHPTPSLDIPISSVLLAIYILGAILHMTTFQLNRKRRSHKFLMSWALFGFCMARNATFVLRIVWATRPTNASVVIASMIFSAAGVLIAYIVMLLLALRLFRATHPELGWSGKLRVVCRVLYVALFVAFVLTISFTIESFYTLDAGIKNVALWVQRASSLVMLLFNVAALVVLCLSIFLPRKSAPENFGTGSIKRKTVILSIMMFFVLFIIGFRFGTTWADAPPASSPAWWDSKPAFYIIEFGLEIVVIFGLLLIRFDRMFWVPNGSAKAGDYHMLGDAAQQEKRLEEGEETNERLRSSGEESLRQVKEKKDNA